MVYALAYTIDVWYMQETLYSIIEEQELFEAVPSGNPTG